MNDQERTRILEEAWANIERAEAQRDELAAELAQRQENELLYSGSTSNEVQPTRAADTYEQPAPQMHPATLKRWEAWANALVQAKLEALSEILGAEAGQMERRLLTQFNAEITQLNDKLQQEQLEVKTLRVVIDELRADVIEILRANNAKNVTPLRSVHVS